MSKWIVVDIGCIHCEEGSGIVGVFTDKERAKGIANKFNDEYSSTSGQHSYEVFTMPEIDTITEPYIEWCGTEFFGNFFK